MRNYWRTAKRFAVVVASPFVSIPTDGLAENNPLVGTWKLKSFVRETVGTGERYNQLGEHPQGFLGYSSDGRMYAILVAGDRIKPQEEAPTDEERIKLHKSMMAYAGTYTVDAGKDMGDDLNLRGSLDLNQVGKPVLTPKRADRD